MIALVEGAERRKTPNEIALGILLAGLTLIFLVVVVTLRPFAEFAEHGRFDRHPDRAARVADPDDDRRPAVRDRDRRHGPARAPQRARAVRPRGGGVRRRRRAAARQDRHDHARQPRGHRVPSDAGCERGGRSPRPRRSRRWPTRRPRAARSSCWPSSTACASTTSTRIRAIRPLLRRDAHERRGPRRHAPAQGRRRRDRGLRRPPRAARPRRSCRPRSTGSPARAARRSPSRATRRCSASST